MQAIREYIAITHPYKDGKSSQRVIEASINFWAKIKKSKTKTLKSCKALANAASAW